MKSTEQKEQRKNYTKNLSASLVHLCFGSELRTQVQHDIVLAIAGNKKDLEEQRQVKLVKAKEYAESVGAIIYETSAKDNEGSTNTDSTHFRFWRAKILIYFFHTGIEELFVDVSRRLIEMSQKKKMLPKNDDASTIFFFFFSKNNPFRCSLCLY